MGWAARRKGKAGVTHSSSSRGQRTQKVAILTGLTAEGGRSPCNSYRSRATSLRLDHWLNLLFSGLKSHSFVPTTSSHGKDSTYWCLEEGWGPQLHISKLPVPPQPHHQTVVPACTAGLGTPDRVPSTLFCGCQESETAGVHTQRRSRHSSLGGPSQVLYKPNPERGPPGFIS